MKQCKIRAISNLDAKLAEAEYLALQDKKCPQQVLPFWGRVHINLLFLIQALSLLRTSRIRIHPEALSFGEVVAKRDSSTLFISVLANGGVYICKIDRGSNPLRAEQVTPIDG